jgi:MFS family permease
MRPNELSPVAASAFGRPTRVRYLVLSAACSVAVVTYLHRVGFARALPELRLSSKYSSWLTAAFLIAYGGFEMPGGLLGDRLGTRHLLTILVGCWSLLTGCVALVVFVPDVSYLPIVYLLLVRFLFGMVQAGAFPLLSRMMTDWMPIQERASAQGAIWMASRAGGMIAPLVVVGLLAVLGNWEKPLWVLAGVGFLWCAVFWPWFRNRPEEMPGVNAAELHVIAAGRDTRPLGHGHFPWRRMLRSRSVWALCLMYGCGGFAANFYVTLLPSYLQNQRKLGATTVSLISSLPFACGMVACLGGGLVSDWLIRRTGNRKWSRRLTGLIGLTLGGLGWLSINWIQTGTPGKLSPDFDGGGFGWLSSNWLQGPWALGFVICAIFFCNDLNMGPAWASCADIGERYAGTLGGAMNMLGALTGAAGNLVAGALFDRHTELVFIIYAFAFWLGALCWLAVDVTKPLVEPHAPEESGPPLLAEAEP